MIEVRKLLEDDPAWKHVPGPRRYLGSCLALAKLVRKVPALGRIQCCLDKEA